MEGDQTHHGGRLLDASDPAHDRCVAMVADLGEDLVVPAAVLIEVDCWLLKLYGQLPWQTFVEDVANGAYRLPPLGPQTLTRAAELGREYPSLDLGLVDASVIATCEELDESKVATIDTRLLAASSRPPDPAAGVVANVESRSLDRGWRGRQQWDPRSTRPIRRISVEGPSPPSEQGSPAGGTDIEAQRSRGGRRRWSSPRTVTGRRR